MVEQEYPGYTRQVLPPIPPPDKPKDSVTEISGNVEIAERAFARGVAFFLVINVPIIVGYFVYGGILYPNPNDPCCAKGSDVYFLFAEAFALLAPITASVAFDKGENRGAKKVSEVAGVPVQTHEYTTIAGKIKDKVVDLSEKVRGAPKKS